MVDSRVRLKIRDDWYVLVLRPSHIKEMRENETDHDQIETTPRMLVHGQPLNLMIQVSSIWMQSIDDSLQEEADPGQV